MKVNWHTAGCWGLAVILGWAGVLKALDPAAFAENITGFRLVPWPVAVALAFYMPWLELVVGLGLILPCSRSAALWLATGLFTGFTLIWAITWARGIDVTCGCFGSGGGNSSAAWPFARTLVLTGITFFMCGRTHRMKICIR